MAFFDLVAKSALTAANTAGDPVRKLLTDLAGALWVRDYMAQPAQGGAAVTKSDDTVLVGVRALFVGGAGNLTLTGADGVDYVLTGVLAGTLLPVSVTKVKAATTATNITALT